MSLPVVSALAREQFDDYVKRVRIFINPRKLHLAADKDRFTETLHQVLEKV